MFDQGRVDDRPGIVEEYWLRRCVWMDAVILHEFVVQRYAVHKKFDPRYVKLVGEFAIDVFECAGIAWAVIRRNTDTQEHDGRATFPGGFDDCLQIAFHYARGEAAQAVVATEFENDEVRFEVTEGRADPGFATFGRFTADAGVNDSIFVPLGLQPGLQQSGPGLVHLYAIAGAQTVAENQHSWRARGLYGGANKEQEKGQYS